MRTRLIKLLLLLDHYNIKPDDPACWLKLAFQLAHDHVPGMRVVESTSRARGAPLKPSDVSGARENVRIIDEINRERGKGVRDAIRIAHQVRIGEESIGWKIGRLVDRHSHLTFAKKIKFHGGSGSIKIKFHGRPVSVLQNQKFTTGEDFRNRTVRCELSTNSHEPLQHKWRRSSECDMIRK